jgi:hypothetical protein
MIGSRSELFYPGLKQNSTPERQSRVAVNKFKTNFLSLDAFLQMNSFPRRNGTEKSETISTPPSSNLSSRNKHHHSVVCCRDVNKYLDVAWTSFFLEILFALPASYCSQLFNPFHPQEENIFNSHTKTSNLHNKIPLLAQRIYLC